jgi:iron complex outermembrane receptor protein
MQYSLFIILCSFAANSLTAQVQQDTIISTNSLPDIEIDAYRGRLKYQAVPASIGLLKQDQLQRSITPQLLQPLNTISGVRLEERSPGSYRLSIRGSLLRAPFGVRNTKIYLNDFILSDAGGNTYVNLLSLTQIQQIEVIKGPAASMYGTGTGGVLLMRTRVDDASRQFFAGIQGGSFGLTHAYVYKQEKQQQWHASHFQSDGYRAQSAMRRNMLQWSRKFGTNMSSWEALAFVADLSYQTPGGLTLTQFNDNPQAARPAAGALPSAVTQRAGIMNTTYFMGIRNRTQLNGNWTIQQQLQFHHTAFRNPFITNYEKRLEDNFAYSGWIQWKKNQWQWQSGGEWLYNQTVLNNYQNNAGIAGQVLFKDVLAARQAHAYTQLQVQLNAQWLIQTGTSINFQRYRYNRLTTPSLQPQERHIQPTWMPRVAISYAATKQMQLFAQISKGFSPPSLAEVRPSDGNYYGELQPEQGWNIEMGIKSAIIPNRLSAELSLYRFRLQQTIVRNTAANGAEFFSNAGTTNQSGAEISMRYTSIKKPSYLPIEIWMSGAYQPYTFMEYRQANQDFSGKELTGIPRILINIGTNIATSNGWTLQLQLNYTDRMPLNDANTVYADAYRLLQAGIAKSWQQTRYTIQWFFNGDNLLNERYSLGNDLNAAGNRFFNAAPSINFNTGIRINKR